MILLHVLQQESRYSVGKSILAEQGFYDLLQGTLMFYKLLMDDQTHWILRTGPRGKGVRFPVCLM